jgi:hypothetical protein
MRITMNTKWFSTIEDVRKFLEGSDGLAFEGESIEEKHQFIQSIMARFLYEKLSKKDKGVIRACIEKVTGYGPAQITRLIQQYVQNQQITRSNSRQNRFKQKYSEQDILLLVETDKLHELNGAAIKKIMEREVKSGHTEYANISQISVSHLYNLRKDRRYRNKYQRYTKTNPVQVPIGKRQKPVPNNQPGYIRIDTVHQGDLDGTKGVYHINAVDEVTQWEVVVTVEKISELYLMPALEELLDQFPFVILNFHSDNGSEFINKTVSKLLNKLSIIQTKSRSRRTNDNALVESKNASVVRKFMGYAHIPQPLASQINEFNREYLNTYINFHKPCFFPSEKIDAKGKIKKCYKLADMMTPYDKFKSLPNAQHYLRSEASFEKLDAIESEHSDNQFAKRMVTNRNDLWISLAEQTA